MSPSILIVGATGNTGGGVLHHLASVLPQSKTLSGHRLIGLTRNTSSAASQELAKLPNAEMLEKDWTFIDAAWLREHEVERLFMASHNGVSQFTDESLFFNAALEAGVKYAVRISTTVSNVGPATPVFYGRNHWAVETMLEQTEFEGLHWTSLRPNVFSVYAVQAAQQWLKTYREQGKKTPFAYMLDGDVGVAIVDPVEVGIIAGHLLALDDPSAHASRKYTVVGPSDATGKEIVSVIEKHAGTSVDDITFRDQSFFQYLDFPKSVLPSLAKAPNSGYDGGASIKATPTSPEVMALYAPQHGLLDMIDDALAAM